MSDNNMMLKAMSLLGPLKRYAYKAQPVTLYLSNDEGTIEKKAFYSVDFELACDRFNLDDARNNNCIYNPHLINIVEPGVDVDVLNPYISHSVLLDKEYYDRLVSVTNSDGKLHSYNGVVDAYSIKDIKDLFKTNEIMDTGICLTEGILRMGGLKRPDEMFNENKHKRYIQASESHRLKLDKTKNSLVLKSVFEPCVYTLDYDNIYAY